MILITSSAIVEPELKAEFGSIPPSFLPVGNKRLFEHQLKSLPSDESIVLTLPEGFQLEFFDKRRLEAAGVRIIFLPLGLSLGEAILYSINLLSMAIGESIKILHGDTLFEHLPDGVDLIAISEVADAYDWAVYTADSVNLLGKHDPRVDSHVSWVASGYFTFSQPAELSRALIEKRFSFIDAVNLYHRRIQLTPIKMEQWYDFGHVHTYYRSKSKMTTQRSFNQLEITQRTVSKRSFKSSKMLAEANWFAEVPKELKTFIPHLLEVFEDDSESGYVIEYMHLTALNELFTFGKLPPFIWRRIFTSCIEFVDTCLELAAPIDREYATIHQLFGHKSKQRLREYAVNKGLDLHKEWRFNGEALPCLTEIIYQIEAFMPKKELQASWYHGDLCFSNILYDFRTNSIKVIDPRGITPLGEISPYGNVIYDLAKLSHSVIGLYDQIIAGNFELNWQAYDVSLQLIQDNEQEQIKEIFIRLLEQRYGLSEDNLLALQIHLFLSMLPLHEDNELRQKAFLANALRLFSKLGATK